MSDLITVFAGPSLRRGDLAELAAAAEARGKRLEIRPPVRRFDLLDLQDSNPGGQVLMLDGEFGQNLAVSISEIRDVLAAGLRMHGAASMGVLRGVECRTLGMTGSGWVYEQYLSGRIESDAEVALLFDPWGFEPVTIPMVNVRWLVARHGPLATAHGQQALALAAGLGFRERRPSVLASTWQRHLATEALDLLLPELADGRRDAWDRKRLDAIEAVHLMLGGGYPVEARAPEDAGRRSC